jgi:hypothetical protein
MGVEDRQSHVDRADYAKALAGHTGSERIVEGEMHEQISPVEELEPPASTGEGDAGQVSSACFERTSKLSSLAARLASSFASNITSVGRNNSRGEISFAEEIWLFMAALFRLFCLIAVAFAADLRCALLQSFNEARSAYFKVYHYFMMHESPYKQ